MECSSSGKDDLIHMLLIHLLCQLHVVIHILRFGVVELPQKTEVPVRAQ